MKVAVIQQNHNPGQVEENRKKAVLAAEKALASGAELVLFHEELLIGYHPEMPRLAEPIDGETSRAMQAVLANSDAKIIYGLTERAGDALYISAPVVTREGVSAVYRKTHLWRYSTGLREEVHFYEPGQELTVFEQKGLRFGILICYDGDFPEMFRSYARLGCDGVLWLNNRLSRGRYDRCIDEAKRNSISVLTSCCCGLDELGQFGQGLSNIVDWEGNCYGELDSMEGMLLADLDFAACRQVRACNPWYTEARPELYL